jgi:SAM-dependent methyltransferase
MQVDRRSEDWLRIWERKYAGVRENSLHVADGYDELTPRDFAEMAKLFLDLADIPDKARVLDVGCGAGAFLQHLRGYRHLAGVDYAEEAIRAIRKRLPGDFRVADAAALPFDDAAFDAVLSFGVFIYFDSLDYARKVLNEMHRVLKPGGRIFIGELNDKLKMDRYRALRVEKEADVERKVIKDAQVDHLFFDKAFFEEFAEDAGCTLEIVDEETLGIPYYSCSLYRFAVILESG